MDWCLRTNRRWLAGGVFTAAVLVSLPGQAEEPRRAKAPVTLQPVPEYAPTAAVLLSADLFAANYHAAELIEAITAAGAEVVIATNAAQTPAELAAVLRGQGLSRQASARVRSLLLPHGNIWMRDYAPFISKNMDMNLDVDMTARGTEAKASSKAEAKTDAAATAAQPLHFFDLIYDDPAAKANDQMPLELGRSLHVPVTPLSLAVDGGNFLTNGEFCFTSSEDLPISKGAALSRGFAAMGCRETVVITAPPHVHLDMWAKIVNDHQVLVNELDDRTLALATRLYGHLPPELKALHDALDQKAADWGRYLQVTRLPMPLPYRGAFRTYSNAILINGHAIVPSYQQFGWKYDSYPDAALTGYYERKIRKIYAALGFQVRMVNADGLIYNGGAFHCVTAQLPKLRAALHPPGRATNQSRKGH